MKHKSYQVNQGDGHHMPLNVLTYRNPSKPHKGSSHGKNHGIVGGKRHTKPVRAYAGAYSQKNEVYVPAPSKGIGWYK